MGVFGTFKQYVVVPVLSTDRYAAGDLFFDVTHVLDMGIYKRAIVHQVCYHDTENHSAQFDVFFVGSPTSWGTINDPVTIGPNRMEYVLGCTHLGSPKEYIDLGSAGFARQVPVGLQLFKEATVDDNVYMAGVLSAPTTYYNTNSLNLHLAVEFF